MVSGDQPAGGETSRTTALVVDDEQHVRNALTAGLTAAGYDVVDAAADGKTAEAMCMLHEPDFVVLDHHLGAGFGGELIARLLYSSPGSRIVVYSANDSAALRNRAMQEGAAAVVDKADGLDALLAALSALA